MLGSARVRTARKAGQKARVKFKKTAKGNEYADYFANLPKQVAKAKIGEKIRTAKQDLKAALEDLAVAEETGEDLLAAQEAAQVARLFVQKLQQSQRPATAAVLTAAGGS